MKVKDDVIKVTVIMSNYNQERFIHRAIKSVLSQKTTFLYDLIIVDDFSQKDNSRTVIKEYEKKYSNIKCILANENSGYLANILRAKKITKTEYFCLLDADDFWIDKYWLQNAYNFLETHKDYVIYESNVLRVDEKEKVLGTFIPKRKLNATFSKEKLLSDKPILITQTTGMFFRNCIFKYGIPDVMLNAVGTLSERSFEGDFDRFIMHLKHGKAYYCRKIIGAYRITSNGIWTKLAESEKMLINARSYCDYYSYYQEGFHFFAKKCKDLFSKYLKCVENEINTCSLSLLTDKTVENYNYVIDFIQSNGVIEEKDRI